MRVDARCLPRVRPERARRAARRRPLPHRRRALPCAESRGAYRPTLSLLLRGLRRPHQRPRDSCDQSYELQSWVVLPGLTYGRAREADHCRVATWIAAASLDVDAARA